MENWTERIDTAVRGHEWREVANILNDHGDVVPNNTILQAVDAFFQNRKVEVDSFTAYVIIQHCNREQRHRLLNRALTEGWWSTVVAVLEEDVNDKQQKKVAVDGFIENATVHYYSDIIPHCDRDQLDRVLSRALTQGWWFTVIKVLKKDVSVESKHAAVDIFIDKASEHVPSRLWTSYSGSTYRGYSSIIPHCDTEQLYRVLNRALTEGWRSTVIQVLEKGVLGKQQKKVAVDAVIANATEAYYSYIIQHCDREQLGRVLNRAVTEGWWSTVKTMLKKGAYDKQQRKLVVDTLIENANNDIILLIIHHCARDQLDRVLNREWWYFWTVVLEKGFHDKQQKKVVVDAFIENATEHCYSYIIPHCDREQLNRVLDRAVTEKWWYIARESIKKGACVATLHTWKPSTYYIIQQQELQDSSETVKLFIPRNTSTLLTTYVDWSQLSEDQKTVVLMVSLEELRIRDTLLPLSLNLSDLSQEELSVCVMILMKEDRWDEISKVCLCHMWEQVGRELLQEAVDQRRWDIVKQWADHTVYDDQRWWAVKEAYKEKKWRVMLLLSDHGLTEIELMWVYYRLAMFADWATVGHMLQRGVDVTDLREVVENAMISTKTARDPAKRLALGKRWQRLKALEQRMSNVSSRQAYKAAKSCKWSVVMPSLHYQYGKIRHQLIQITLKTAIEHSAWHVVLQLIKLDMEQAQRDSLFTDMVRQQQWGVCRALLDHGISVHLCLDVLPQLMQEDQWLLVARMMEYDLDDAKRREVMQRAMERRQGSVVWRCISTMQHYRLSEEEREQLFHQAISRCVLQAVKPLIEEKDQTGLRHRDGALLAGIELRQWDVVDYCQEQRADINVKNDEGETPLNRAARKQDWKTVKALVVRGGDTNILDTDGVSLLDRTIEAKQMDLTKLVIEYHGDINKKTEHVTPLQSLINRRNGDVIHHTLMWCPDQAKVVNEKGETTLHAIALDKRPEFLYHQVVRGVNPVRVTKSGKSVLMYAVMNEHCAQRMVAECIRLGFSTHQSALTVTNEPLKNYLLRPSSLVLIFPRKSFFEERSITSPLRSALMSERFILAHMLYESGSCSYSELFHIYNDCLDFFDLLTKKDWELRYDWQPYIGERYDELTTFMPYLREMATTPRSLVSTCRLVISHCLNVRRRYESDVYQLGLTDRMTNYILFSDLTDPDYEPAWYVTAT